MIRSLLIAGVMAFCLGTTALADSTGRFLPKAQIEGLTQSPAASFDEFAGRVVLIEFFAYW